MIDTAPLTPYGISVREKDEAGALLAYAPLNVVTDPVGGANVAFQARMYYETDSDQGMAWASAQQVRVVWLVQMLTDECDTTGFEPSEAAQEPAEGYQAQYAIERKAWCAGHRTADLQRIVQTYDEAWYLTGLRATEDLGMDFAIIWEDPATDNDQNADDRLWQAARGLLTSFVSGRDGDGNGQLDVGINARNGADGTIAERLDAEGSVPDDDDRRWGIPKNALQVKSFEFPHGDYVGQIAAQDAEAILVEQFSPYVTDTQTITPTLLFARQETSVGVDLADAVVTGGDGGTVALDFDGKSSMTMAQIAWAPFRYNETLGPDRQPIGWERFPTQLYWDRLAVQFKAAFRNLPEEVNPYRDDEYVVMGQMLAARSLYFALETGVTRLVQTGSENEGPQPDIVLPYTNEGNMDSDAGITTASLGLFSSACDIVLSVVGDMIEIDANDVIQLARLSGSLFGSPTSGVGKFLAGAGDASVQFLRLMGNGALRVASPTIVSYGGAIGAAKGGPGPALGVAALFVAGLGAMAACVAAIAGSDSPVEAISWSLQAIGMILEVKGIIDAVNDIGKAASGGGAAATGLIGKVAKFLSKSVESVGAVMSTIAAGVGVAVTWAVFAAQAALMDLTYREMGNLVALTIGQTIVMVIMFIIDLIPVVGGIISGIISLLDSLIAALCSAAGWDQEKAGQTDPYDDPGDWLCGGIEGIVSTFLGWFIYAGNEIVDMQAEGRLQFDEVNANELTDPERGITTGNALNVGVVLTNTLTMMGRPGNIGGGYYWQFSKKFKSSTFEYRMQTTETDIHEDLDRWAMEDEWQDVPAGQAGDIYIHETVPAIPVTLPAAGINRRLQVYLSEGYNIPVQNCYVGFCVVEDERDTIHYPMTDTLVFDILPATLDEFYSRSWGQDYSIGVVTMTDEDGDGLAAGVDPNDLRQDTDGDGLIDPRELQFGASPTLSDTDGDGLNDYDEIRLNTDPTRKDTDGDGLWDGQEVYHQDKGDVDLDDDRVEWVGGWRYVYRINAAGQQESAWVASDPEKVDTDGDGLLDRDEFLYGFNPTVWSNARVLSLESQLREPAAEGGYAPTDGMVQPGSTLYYTATVTNNLLSRYMQGLLSSQFPAAADPNALAPVSFVLQPTQAQTLDGELDVSATAASGVYSATLTASALISDWTALAEGAKLWLPMDDPVTDGPLRQLPAQRRDLFRHVHFGRGRALRQRAEPGRRQLPVLAGRPQRNRLRGFVLVQDGPGQRSAVRGHG